MAYTAIIVEPRRHPALEFVLTNFLENLSDDWNIIVFHGTENIEYVANIVSKLEHFKTRITLHNLGVRNLAIAEYSRLFATRSFYDNIPTETFLVFQTDTMLFSKNKEVINQVLQYDYVGAPWPDSMGGTRVGNGGLSLRKKSKMMHIINSRPYRGEPEDIYFCSNPLYMPTVEEAMRFSVEHVFYPESFGCHKPWAQGWGVSCSTSLIHIYPELAELHRLNGIAVARTKPANSPKNLCLGPLHSMQGRFSTPPTQNKKIIKISSERSHPLEVVFSQETPQTQPLEIKPKRSLLTIVRKRD